MKSITGILTLSFVLSVNLCTLTAFPADSCKIVAMLKLVKHEIKELHSGLNIHVPHNGKIIDDLVINKSLPISKQNKTAVCGLIYMKKALEEIHHHQTLNNSESIKTIFKDVIKRLNTHIPGCVHHVLGQCGNPPQPKWNHNLFQAKRWTQNFLESSEKFLHELILLL